MADTTVPATALDRPHGSDPAARAAALPVIDALTGIRAVAAVFVLLFHFRAPLLALLPGLYAIDPWMRLGFLSIDVFFVLSGFIISYNYAEKLVRPDREKLRSYFVARIARIYPVYLLTTLAAAAIVGWYAWRGVVLNPAVERTVPGLVGNLFLLQSFPGIEAWNGPAWTVSSEMVAYVLFPLFAWLLVRLGRKTAVALAFAVVALELVGIQALSPYPELFPFNWVRLAGGFAVGCLAWAAWRHGVRPHWRWDVVAIGCVAYVAVSPVVGSPWYVIPFLALFVVAATSVTGPVRAFLASRPVEWGGRMSYSIYLVHMPVIILVYLVLPPTDFVDAPLSARVAIVAAYLLTIVLVAAAVYYGVEEPARRWVRRRLGKPRVAPRPVPRA